MRIKLLIIGAVDDPEFAGVGDFLGLLPNVTIEQVHGIADCVNRDIAGAEPSPDLIVILERHPDEHPSQEIRRLIETHPLARIVCGYGPWSESAMRNRGVWPPATWVPIGLLREHILAELQIIRGDRPPLAITADRADAFEQRYAATSSGRQQPALASLKVAVDVPDAEYRTMLEDELSLQSAQIVDVTEDWDLLLFDAHPEAHRLRELQRLLNSRSTATGRIVVLHEMPNAAARATWSSEKLQTPLDVNIISKLAPLARLLRLS